MMEKFVELLAGETEVLGKKNCPSAAFSTTNPTCSPDGNPGRRGGKPATNCLSYSTALTLLPLGGIAHKHTRQYLRSRKSPAGNIIQVLLMSNP
jgi:hypothetical protein